MRIERISGGFFGTNTYIVVEDESCIIIDPGEEIGKIVQRIRELGCTPLKIISTHAHFDHILGVNSIKREFRIPFLIHPEELPILREQKEFVKTFWGLDIEDIPESADGFVEEGDKIGSLKVIHTPGHSPGSITLLGDSFAFVGDLIFKESVGRTDLPGGDDITLLKSIHRVLQLPDDTVLYPGHGPETTVGHEKKHNPFIQRLDHRI